MPAVTSNHVNYLVWRYLQEEGLALSGYTLDRETHASQWDSELRAQTGDGELVRLVLKGLQMLELEAVRLPPDLLADTQARPVNMEAVPAPARLRGGFATAFAPLDVPHDAPPAHAHALVVGGPDGVDAYRLPGLVAVGSAAFAAPEPPTCIEAAAAASTLFVGYENGAVRGWRLHEHGAELQSVLMLPDAEHAPVTVLRRAPSGHLLASVDVRNVVALWDVPGRVLVARIDLGGMDTALLADVAWVTDTMFAALLPDAVAVYTVAEPAAPRKRFPAPGVAQLAFDPVSRLLASGCDDGRVFLWSSHTDEPYRVISDHHGPITHVSWVPDTPVSQPYLATASTDGWLKLWTLDTARPAAAAHAGDAVLLVEPSDTYIAAVTKRGVKIYTKALVCVAEYSKEGVRSVALRGRTLVVAANNETAVFEVGVA